jgi:hypothetical protein
LAVITSIERQVVAFNLKRTRRGYELALKPITQAHVAGYPAGHITKWVLWVVDQLFLKDVAKRGDLCRRDGLSGKGADTRDAEAHVPIEGEIDVLIVAAGAEAQRSILAHRADAQGISALGWEPLGRDQVVELEVAARRLRLPDPRRIPTAGRELPAACASARVAAAADRGERDAQESQLADAPA